MNCHVVVTHIIANDYLHLSQSQYGFPYSASLSQVQLNFVNILKVVWNRFVKGKYWIENRNLRPWYWYSVHAYTRCCFEQHSQVLYSIQIYVEKLQFMGDFCVTKLFRSIHWSYLEEIEKEKTQSYLIYWCFYDTMQPAIKCRETIPEYTCNTQGKTTLWGVFFKKKNSLWVVLLMRQSPFVNDVVFGNLFEATYLWQLYWFVTQLWVESKQISKETCIQNGRPVTPKYFNSVLFAHLFYVALCCDTFGQIVKTNPERF